MRQRPGLAAALMLLVCCLLSACASRPSGRGSAPLPLPPVLRARFDSARAAVLLSWARGPEDGFVRYEVQRDAAHAYATLAVLTAIDDTTHLEEGLPADTPLRFRVVTYVQAAGGALALPSAAAEGGIHRRVSAWQVGGDEPFLPTRLAVDRRGVVWVVGAGRGVVARFDRAGNPLAEVALTEEPLACLETGTLNGPSLALGDEGSMYVAYNVCRPEGPPAAFWSRFDSDGVRVWTRPLEGLFARHVVAHGDRMFVESISQLQEFDGTGQRLRQYLVPAVLVSSLRMWSGSFAALVEPLRLLEGDWGAPRLVVYEEAGRQSPQTAIGRDPAGAADDGDGLLRWPTDFAVDEATGRSFVVNAGFSRIEVFRDQRFLTRWGTAGSAPGQFRFSGEAEVVADIESGRLGQRPVLAGGIAIDDEGFVYVADTFNNRVQKFRP